MKNQRNNIIIIAIILIVLTIMACMFVGCSDNNAVVSPILNTESETDIESETDTESETEVEYLWSKVETADSPESAAKIYFSRCKGSMGDVTLSAEELQLEKIYGVKIFYNNPLNSHMLSDEPEKEWAKSIWESDYYGDIIPIIIDGHKVFMAENPRWDVISFSDSSIDEIDFHYFKTRNECSELPGDEIYVSRYDGAYRYVPEEGTILKYQYGEVKTLTKVPKNSTYCGVSSEFLIFKNDSNRVYLIRREEGTLEYTVENVKLVLESYTPLRGLSNNYPLFQMENGEILIYWGKSFDGIFAYFYGEDQNKDFGEHYMSSPKFDQANMPGGGW